MSICKRTLFLLLVILGTACATTAYFCDTANAASGVTIRRIADSVDEHMLNTSLDVGKTNAGFDIKYKISGFTEKNHTWSSSDTSIFTVSENSDSTATIKGAAPGIAKLNLKVIGTDKETYTDSVYVSVVDRFSPDRKGKTIKRTMMYRSARMGDDNRNERGYVPNGTELTVLGQSAGFYRVLWEEYNIDDGLNNGYGYVAKSNIKIYSCEVTYDANGGSGSMAGQTVIYGTAANLKENSFNRTGYTFTGWSTKKDGSGKSYADGADVTTAFSSAGSVTLYAKWKANVCNLFYDANGGKGNVAGQTITYSKAATARANDFARQGYTFTEWNTKKDGSGKSYKEGSDISKAFPGGGNVTLYAQWKEILVSSISVNADTITGQPGQTINPGAKALPANALNKTISYSSSNSDVASISSNGTVTLKGQGTAEITAKSNNGKKAMVYVSVYEQISDLKNHTLTEIKGYTKVKTDLSKSAANNNIKLKAMEKNEDVSVLGECKGRYYISCGNYRGFVMKNALEIPLVKLKILGGKIELKKRQKRALKVKYIPSITTQKNVTWKSNKKTIATVSRRGVVLGKAIGKFTISASAYGLSTKVGGSIATCRNIDWTRKRNVKETTIWKKGKLKRDKTMQGLTGFGKTIFFIRLQRNNRATQHAKLYRCSIKDGNGKYKVDEVYEFPENKHVGHGNGMTLLNKNNLFIAPCVEWRKDSSKRIVYRVSAEKHHLGKQVKKYYIKDGKLANGKKFKATAIKKINSIATWKYKHKKYLIMNCTYDLESNSRKNYVFGIVSNTLRCKYKFDTPVPYSRDGHPAAQQGATVSIDNNKYYLVVSQGKRTIGYCTKEKFRSIWGRSYVYRFELKIKNNELKAVSDATYRLSGGTRGKKITRKSGRKNNAEYYNKFEMEDLYIYRSKGRTRLFFNSEGGENLIDFIGMFKE